MTTLHVFSPCKLNLFLAITGRRDDGFHDLVSVASTLDFGDELTLEVHRGGFELRCDHPDLPVDQNNLVLRAARAFAEAAAWDGGARIVLHKRTPLGAGLGGGSSNAAATLRALNRLAGHPLTEPQLATIAAQLGSDCSLFLGDGPVIMRGRGERLQSLNVSGTRRLLGRRVLLFKPAFGIETAWAYRQMAAAQQRGAQPYLPSEDAERRLAAWQADDSATAEALLFNNMESVAFEKFVALPTLLARLAEEHGWTARMSGSGSACYGLLSEGQAVDPLIRTIREAWGESAWHQASRITAPTGFIGG